MTVQPIKTKIPKAKVLAKEIKLKCGELPKGKFTPDKKIEIKLIDEDGTIYTAKVSPKSYRQAETEVAAFEIWVLVVSGKLQIAEQGCNILEAGIKVFEWKENVPEEIKQTKTKVAQAKVVKREISIKFSTEFPRAIPMPNKLLKVELIDDDEITYIASIKRKHWHTAETDAAEFENWMALVGGKLSITEEGYNILEPTIRVFEEKVKVISQ
jgi:hypothetical protein